MAPSGAGGSRGELGLDMSGYGSDPAIDYGFVLVVLDTTTGEPYALRDDDRRRWRQYGHPVSATPPPAATTTIENQARLPNLPPVPGERRWAARATLLRAYLAGREGFGATLRLVRGTHRRAFGPADTAEVAEALIAVRTVAALAPFRVRAVDECVAALLLLRPGRRTATFRYGTTIDPVRVHAWLEVDGAPVGQPPWVSRYTPFPS